MVRPAGLLFLAAHYRRSWKPKPGGISRAGAAGANVTMFCSGACDIDALRQPGVLVRKETSNYA